MAGRRKGFGMAAKTAAFLLCLLSVAALVVGIVAVQYLWEEDFYTESESWRLEYEIGSRVNRDATRLFFGVMQEDHGIYNYENEAYVLYEGESNLYFVMRDDKGKLVTGRGIDGSRLMPGKQGEEAAEILAGRSGDYYVYTYTGTECFGGGGENAAGWGDYDTGKEKETFSYQPYLNYTATLYLDRAFPFLDNYGAEYRILRLGYAWRYWIYPVTAAAGLCAVCCFIFLLCAAGRRPGTDPLIPGVFVRIPLDLYLVLVVFCASVVIQWYMEKIRHSNMVVFVFLSVLALAAFLGFCMDIAVRVKQKNIWKTTCLYWLLVFCRRIVFVLARGFRAFFGSLPLMWKTVAVVAGCLFLDGIITLGIGSAFRSGWFWLYFFLFRLALTGFVLYLAYVMVQLKKGGRALAEGDFEHPVNTKGMIFDWKEHGENLNRIKDGMLLAVEERLKSERMKTELITNVSHDIKTPLTSIINYTDLILKEQPENEKIREYAAVLARQSARLKKLIEDLVEASKASTGNLEIRLVPMDVGVVLIQVTGEYAERLKQNRLDLIVKRPEEELRILADGKHLWRIFDNLMSNVCKYAQEGTRVYLTVEKKTDQAVITLKNTSRYPLDIPAKELMERFVRGDSSRSTEGNGLGLSIAQSLTQLQRGAMELFVDGDLFKVVLSFPILAG